MLRRLLEDDQTQQVLASTVYRMLVHQPGLADAAAAETPAAPDAGEAAGVLDAPGAPASAAAAAVHDAYLPTDVLADIDWSSLLSSSAQGRPSGTL